MDQTKVFDDIKRHIGEYLEQDVSQITLDTKLLLIVPGMDSLKLFEAMLYLEDCFNIELGDNILDNVKNVGDLVQHIDSILALKSEMS